MIHACNLVSIVDDDESIRESLPDLLRSFAIEAEAFPSPEDFLASGKLSETACLVLDLAMPGMSGLDLHDELTRQGVWVPVIFVSAHFEELALIAVGENAIVACLSKPFSEEAIIGAVRSALEHRQ